MKHCLRVFNITSQTTNNSWRIEGKSSYSLFSPKKLLRSLRTNENSGISCSRDNFLNMLYEEIILINCAKYYTFVVPSPERRFQSYDYWVSAGTKSLDQFYDSS